LARLFYALYFGPDDQKNLVNLEQYTAPGHELLMEAVDQSLKAGLVRPDCQQELAMALHGMINIWVIAVLTENEALSRELAERIVNDLLRGYGQD